MAKDRKAQIEVECPICHQGREVSKHGYDAKIRWGKTFRCRNCALKYVKVSFSIRSKKAKL